MRPWLPYAPDRTSCLLCLGNEKMLSVRLPTANLSFHRWPVATQASSHGSVVACRPIPRMSVDPPDTPIRQRPRCQHSRPSRKMGRVRFDRRPDSIGLASAISSCLVFIDEFARGNPKVRSDHGAPGNHAARALLRIPAR